MVMCLRLKRCNACPYKSDCEYLDDEIKQILIKIKKEGK